MSSSIHPISFGVEPPRSFVTQTKPISFGMQVPAHTSLQKENPTFTYSNELKTLFRKGKLPTVKFDAAGNKLNKKNVSLDHIIPASKGGKSVTENFMLADRDFNNARGSDSIFSWVTTEGIIKYLAQFVDVRVGKFIGNSYIAQVLKTLERANELGV